MESWLSWTIMIALVGAAYWYYSQNNTRRRHRSRPLQRVPEPAARAKEDLNRLWNDAEDTSKGPAKSAKAKPARKANKKPSLENADKAEAYLSTASSTAGADADDDLSPAVSPALGATNIKPPSGKDVSDMLESHGPPPAVLRLTPSNEPMRQKHAQQQRPATPQETKKQRQNKKKAEEAKLQREEDEKARKVLLEKQRRSAREARGEPAKNGLQPARAPTSNPWSALNVAGTNTTTVPAHDNQLLDTFEPDTVSTTSSSEHTNNGTSATTDSMNSSMHWTNMPSEEEQMRMAMEDSEWTTVPKGRKARKNKTNGADGNATEGSDTSVTQPNIAAKKTFADSTETVQPKAPLKNSVTASDDTAVDAKTNHPLDSDWPVV